MLCLIYFFLIDQRPPRSTRTGTLVPDTKLFRSPSGPLCGTGRDGSPAVGSAGRQPAGDYGRRRVPGRLKERHAMLLAINANNTNTKFGVTDGDRIVGEWRRHTSAMRTGARSEEHTSEPQSLMRTSYAGFCSNAPLSIRARRLYPCRSRSPLPQRSAASSEEQ